MRIPVRPKRILYRLHKPQTTSLTSVQHTARSTIVNAESWTIMHKPTLEIRMSSAEVEPSIIVSCITAHKTYRAHLSDARGPVVRALACPCGTWAPPRARDVHPRVPGLCLSPHVLSLSLFARRGFLCTLDQRAHLPGYLESVLRSGSRDSPSELRARLSVFFISIAIVIGPTPPGTGVILPATWLADAKSTSPHSL